MDFFDKIGSVTKSLADKTSNKVSTVRLNARINSLKTSIAVQKQRIGDFYWQRLHEDGSFDPELSEEFGQIAKYLDEIAALEREIQRLAENETAAFEKAGPIFAGVRPGCPSCGSANPPGTKFCVFCGAALAASAVNTCGNCGEPVDDEMIFCAGCGAKLKNNG
jgi:hypothetical protein